MRTKPLVFWAIPALVWACFMCWAAGYQSGFSEGQDLAWGTARKTFVPVASHQPTIADSPVLLR